MKSEKAYTPAQLDNADRTMALLATLPENRRSMAITMANAFTHSSWILRSQPLPPE